MKQVVWNDSYKMGVDFIDREHQQLFSIMNKLLAISENKEKSEWVCREGVKYIKNHTEEHFEHEEEYMRSINYGEYETHKRLHDNFRYKTLPALEAEMEKEKFSDESIRHFLGVCIGWVIAHTQTEDTAIAGKRTSKWAHISPEEEKHALELTINQIIQELFRLEANMISEHYAGEDFGNMICCSFLYRGVRKSGAFTLVFEEQLVLMVLGKILNAKYPKIDDMALNVVRYISRQFLERIKESFAAVGVLEMEKECLLTHEQLLKLLEREQPACSMLFDTGEGYFAFCVTATDPVQGKISFEIDPQNAMNAIGEFLVRENEEQAKRKKKILLVDDSDFMRRRMIQLLEKDYDLIEADSSISAIRKIVLNRPDLILMDYEMPVCDGKQVFEMIRSDKESADIPVIFLTGRGDRESVEKVMSLKPQGYFLKTMQGEDIKKLIDEFFLKRGR